MQEGLPTQDDQTPAYPVPEEISISMEPSAGGVRPMEGPLSPERRREIITAINNELANEMKRLHSAEAFHNEEHIEDVGADAAAILAIFKKFGMTGEDDTLAAAAAANGHDLVINHTVVTDRTAFNYGQRMRHRGFAEMIPANVKSLGIEKGNEELSWERTREIITKFDPNKEVYTDEVLEKIRRCIAATYPEAYPATLPEGTTTIANPENGELVDLTPYLGKDKEGKPMAFKFDQPFLLSEPESDPSTLSVAFGDLMYGGKCSSEAFTRHGNDEYQETREMIMAEIKGGVEAISPERKAEIAKDMTSWIGTQVGFLLWQKVRFDNVLNTFKPINESPHANELKKDLSDLYGKFDQNLVVSKNRVDLSARFAPLKNPQTYIDDPETARALFADLLSEMGVSQNKIVFTKHPTNQ